MAASELRDALPWEAVSINGVAEGYDGPHWTTLRAAVPGGWLVMVAFVHEVEVKPRVQRTGGVTVNMGGGFHVSRNATLTFVPDPQHHWVLGATEDLDPLPPM